MKMIVAVMYREFLIRSTTMTWLFYDLFMPVIYLLLFGLGLDRAMGGEFAAGGQSISYNAFFLPGVLSMACFGIAVNTAVGFFVDRDNGIFYEHLTYPMSRAEFLMGKILFNSLLSLLQAAITLLLGMAVLDIPVTTHAIMLVLPGMVIGTAGWFFFLTIFALRIRRNDVFNTVLNVLYFVLMFASSLFYPLDGMPAWLRFIGLSNPLTWHTDVLRVITTGGAIRHDVMLEAGAFLLFTLASFVAAVRTLTRSILR